MLKWIGKLWRFIHQPIVDDVPVNVTPPCDLITEFSYTVTISPYHYSTGPRKMRTTKNKPSLNKVSKPRQIPGYASWKQKVYQRDYGYCQCCGKRENYRAEHHIYSYHAHPELRTHIDNGITLCWDCHGEFHSIYGLRNNTLDQLQEFLRNHGALTGPHYKQFERLELVFNNLNISLSE